MAQAKVNSGRSERGPAPHAPEPTRCPADDLVQLSTQTEPGPCGADNA